LALQAYLDARDVVDHTRAYLDQALAHRWRAYGAELRLA
jgi:hypothetical protein